MSDSILRFAGNIFSQCGEDLLLDEVIRRIKPSRTCCEFGAANAVFCSNTYNLLQQGWTGLMFEGDPAQHQPAMVNLEGLKCNYVTAMITPENINYYVPQKLGVLSIDTDGPCSSIWMAYNGKPDIVVIEINSSLDPNVDFYHPSKGANFSYMNRLAETKGYFLLCHTGNCIYLLNKYKGKFPDASNEFKRDWL